MNMIAGKNIGKKGAFFLLAPFMGASSEAQTIFNNPVEMNSGMAVSGGGVADTFDVIDGLSTGSFTAGSGRVVGALGVDDGLTVIGGVSSDTVSVSGALSAGDLTAGSGRVLAGLEVGDGLTVSGETTTDTLAVADGLTATTFTVGSGRVIGALDVGDGLTVLGGASADTLAVAGELGAGAVTAGSARVLAGLEVGDGLKVSGETTTDKLIVTDGVEGDLIVNGDVEAASIVADVSRLRALTVTEDLQVDGRLIVGGSFVLPENVEIDALTVSGLTRLTALEASGPVVISTGGAELRVDDTGVDIASSAGGRLHVGDSSASLTYNDAGIVMTNGSVAVDATDTVLISGGGTSLGLTGSGARLSSSTGQPVRLSGIADGVRPNDAVNVRQLERGLSEVSRGVAMSMAMTQIPAPDHGKKYSLGLGLGNFSGETAFAAGASIRVVDGLVVRGSFSHAGEGSAGVGVGVGWSF